MEYQATADYRAEIQVNGSTEPLVLVKGQVVELTEDQAAAVERDAPGLLKPAAKAKATKAKATDAEPDA